MTNSYDLCHAKLGHENISHVKKIQLGLMLKKNQLGFISNNICMQKCEICFGSKQN